MSAIARILLLRGFSVSGSDRNCNDLTNALDRDGATIYQGHDAKYVDGANMVIATSAAKQDHVEIVAARAKGIPVYKRNDIIQPLMDGYSITAVAGTHGKTTTTSMIIHAGREIGRVPNYIVGGVMGNTGTNADVGDDNAFIIEADEYDNMFWGINANDIVLTNVEYDHPDFFKSEQQLVDSFVRFVNNAGEHDNVWFCSDSPLAGEVVERTFKNGKNLYYMSYGFSETSIASWIYHTQISNVRVDDSGFTLFDFTMGVNQEYSEGDSPKTYTVRIPLPGKHNVLNAMAALYPYCYYAEDAEEIQRIIKTLESFKTTGRRYDIRGEIDGIVVVDDYAHHPSAIKTTLEATKLRYPDKKIYSVWQPHTYSRTQTLLNEFIVAFDSADYVLVTDIYAAREKPVEGVTGETTAQAIQHPHVRHVSGLDAMCQHLIDEVQSPAVIIIMSAGDAIKIGSAYLERKRTAPTLIGDQDVNT